MPGAHWRLAVAALAIGLDTVAAQDDRIAVPVDIGGACTPGLLARVAPPIPQHQG